MKKSTRNIIVAVIIALLVFGIAIALYGHFHTEPINANTVNNSILDDANTGLENFINDILDEDNDTENTQNEENIENNNTTTKNTQTSSANTNTQSTTKNNNVVENQTTPGEKKAVELAKEEWKKEWGSLDDVSFNNVMIQGDGKYVVSVNDSKTTKVICRYVVDTVTGVVEEQ